MEVVESKPTSSPETASKLKLKLLVDQNANHVLFAEVGKDVVDFLFGLLSLPLGSVARLLSKYRMLGSIDMLCGSVESLDDAYVIDPFEDRHALLSPQIFSSSTLSLASVLLENDKSLAQPAKKYYRCKGDVDCRGRCFGNFGHVTDVRGTRCPSCSQAMTEEMQFVAGDNTDRKAEAGGGYVKGVVITYMVLDDLSVMPTSTTSAITLLNKLHIKDLSSLYEWTMELDMEKGLDLLKASLLSKTVLTDVFLGTCKSGVPVV